MGVSTRADVIDQSVSAIRADIGMAACLEAHTLCLKQGRGSPDATLLKCAEERKQCDER